MNEEKGKLRRRMKGGGRETTKHLCQYTPPPPYCCHIDWGGKGGGSHWMTVSRVCVGGLGQAQLGEVYCDCHAAHPQEKDNRRRREATVCCCVCVKTTSNFGSPSIYSMWCTVPRVRMIILSPRATTSVFLWRLRRTASLWRRPPQPRTIAATAADNRRRRRGQGRSSTLYYSSISSAATKANCGRKETNSGGEKTAVLYSSFLGGVRGRGRKGGGGGEY